MEEAGADLALVNSRQSAGLRLGFAGAFDASDVDGHLSATLAFTVGTTRISVLEGRVVSGPSVDAREVVFPDKDVLARRSYIGLSPIRVYRKVRTC